MTAHDLGVGVPNHITTRIAAFDGLRGIACVLVVLGHLWLIVSWDVIDGSGPLRGLFRSQNLGVTVFLVLGGFLVTSHLLNHEQQTSSIDVGRFWIRRLARICSQLYLMLVVLIVVNWLDRYDDGQGITNETTKHSVIGVATFTFNWNLINDALNARPDLGHLWYLSVEQQFYFVWVMVLVWLGRYRTILMGLLSVAFVAIVIKRFSLLGAFDRVSGLPDGWWNAGLMTSTRSDGLALGAVAALILPLVADRKREAQVLTIVGFGSVAGLVLLSGPLSDWAYLETQGVLFAGGTSVMVLALAVNRDADGVTERILSWPPFRFFGRVSFPLYLWHLPAFYAAGRWARDIGWLPRLMGTVVVLSVIVFVSQTFVERPVANFLARDQAFAWFDRLRRPAN